MTSRELTEWQIYFKIKNDEWNRDHAGRDGMDLAAMG